ncbi:MAG TPA: hypothetical protein VKA27_15940 [Sunxiuqinia sp.]|nr:hypothetical protein [Sunxiuqinia sp.]
MGQESLNSFLPAQEWKTRHCLSEFIGIQSETLAKTAPQKIPWLNFLYLCKKANDMVTIKINEHTKAGKALIETARIMAQKFKGIDIIDDNGILYEKMKANHQSDLLSEPEKADFLKELKNTAK